MTSNRESTEVIHKPDECSTVRNQDVKYFGNACKLLFAKYKYHITF